LPVNVGPSASAIASALSAAPPVASSDDSLLEDMLLADLQGGSPRHETATARSTPSDRAELAAFRDAMRPAPTSVVAPTAPRSNRIPRLKVVQTGVEGHNKTPVTKITYIYGERNIEVYRRWRKLHYAELTEVGESVNRGGVEGSVKGGRTCTWHEKVEEALRVHRRLSAELVEGRLSKADARAKRCRSCHWLGHDSSFAGCPNSEQLLGEEEEVEDVEEETLGVGVGDEDSEAWRDVKRPRVGDDE
jgi:hypothetical protein